MNLPLLFRTLSPVYTYFKTCLFELREQRRVERLFYQREGFRKKDRALIQAYRGESPYQISKRYLIEQGESDPYQYGETPLTTIAAIADAFEISSSDLVIEMGAGRGRVALFLAEYIGCRVMAFEKIPRFVEKMVSSEKVEVAHMDMFEAPFGEATVVFLYGTMLPDEFIRNMAEKIPSGVRVITVSYSLSYYDQNYQTTGVITGIFPWGKTEVYLNERVFEEVVCPL